MSVNGTLRHDNYCYQRPEMTVDCETCSACLSIIVYNEEVAAKNYRLNCETHARINHMANGDGKPIKSRPTF